MITKSAEKAFRQNLRHRERNLNTKEKLRTQLKAYKALLATDKNAAQAQLSKVFKALDKTAKSGVIKKNKASRLKSRLSALLAVKS